MGSSCRPDKEEKVNSIKPQRLLVLLLAAVIASALVVAGCGGGGSSSGGSTAPAEESEAEGGSSEETGETSEEGGELPKETIAYVEPAAVDEVTNRNVSQMEASAKALGWELKFTNAQGDQSKVTTAVENAVNEGVDAIVVGSEDAKLIRQPLLKAEQAGIPAVVIGGEVEEDPLYVAEYTENEPLMSKLLTEKMVENLGGKGEVAAMEIGQLTSGITRMEAREEVLEGTEVEVVDKQEGSLEDPIQGTKKIASSMLAAHPNLSAMWLVYDYMMVPTTEVLKSTGNSTTQIYTWFAGPENVELLRSNPQVKALIENDFDHTGLIAMDQLAGHFANGTDINPEALEECPLKYETIEKGNAPPAGELKWPLEQNAKPFYEMWEKGEYGKGADCGPTDGEEA
jgi:ABC-type sugar transport system substrate-binding protein